MAMYLFLVLIFMCCSLVRRVFIVWCLSLQAGERTVKENGQPEAQGAAGEEQERPADGGRQEERGQSERKFPADKGVWSGRGWVGGTGRYSRESFSPSFSRTLKIVSYHNNASS